MGVDLGELCPAEPITIQDLAGKIVAIDAFNTLYQFLATIRGPDGTPLRDDQGRVTSHLSGILQRTAHLCEAGLAPIFVFDGPPHPLKRATIEERRRRRQKAQVEYEAALAAGDLELARSKAQQTSTLSDEMIGQSKRLLHAFGIPVVDAPGEGEAQASALARTGAAYACGSQDFDSLLFGAPRLVRNLTVSGRRKLPGRQAWADVAPERIDLEAGLKRLALSREQLVDVALLVGTDFNSGVLGIGPKTALKLLQECSSLERLFEVAPERDGAVWRKLETGKAGLGELAQVRRIFLEPTVISDPRIEWGRLNAPAVLDLLVREHRFSPERVEAALAKFKAAPMYRRQKSLTDWA